MPAKNPLTEVKQPLVHPPVVEVVFQAEPEKVAVGVDMGALPLIEYELLAFETTMLTTNIPLVLPKLALRSPCTLHPVERSSAVGLVYPSRL